MKLTPDQENFLWDNYNKMSVKEIVEKLGITYNQYYKFRKDNDLNLDLRKTVTPYLESKIMDYFFNNNDNRVVVIAKEFGLSLDKTSKIISANLNRKYKG